MNRPTRPTQIVAQDIHEAAQIIAGSELCLDGQSTDLSGILRALDGAGLRFNEGDLNTVIERARGERAAWIAANAVEVRRASV